MDDSTKSREQLITELEAARAELAALRAPRDVTAFWTDPEVVRQVRAICAATRQRLYVYDLDRRYLFAAHPPEQGAFEMDAMVGKTPLELGLPPEQVAASSAYFNQAIASGRPVTGETVYDTPIGRRNVMITFAPLTGPDGRVAAVASTLRDVTELYRAEEALRQSEARFRGLTEAAFEGVAIHEKGRILEVNQPLADLFGYPMAEMIGMSVDQLSAPETRELVRARIEAGVQTPYEAIGLRKDGTTFAGELYGKEIPYKGRLVRVTAVRDITERKRAYEEIAQRTAELRKAHELDKLKSNFVNAVTHELRTPLTSIKGYAEFLEDGIGGELNETQLSFVRHLEMGASRLERLVDDLLDFARIEAGTFKLRLADADLTAKIRDTAGSLDPQTRDGRLSLELALPEEPVRVTMDAQRIGQVLLNLLNNAIKFTPPGGTIAVRVRQQAGMVRCEVADTGIGIQPEDLPKLFQRFSQLEGGLRAGTGTGLGLSIAKAIVEAHGGEIGVTSTPGQGSTFWFTLPAAPRLVPEELLEETGRSR